MATHPARKLRYEDYVRFPDDGRRWELIGGEAFMVPSPNTAHQKIIGMLFRQIADHLDVRGGGQVFVAPLDVLLSEEDVVQPDVVYTADDDDATITEPNIRGAPAWVIEVVSDPVRDKKVKRELYMSSGVREYWAVDPYLRRIEVFRPGDEHVIVEERGSVRPRSLPGLAIDVDALLGD